MSDDYLVLNGIIRRSLEESLDEIYGKMTFNEPRPSYIETRHIPVRKPTRRDEVKIPTFTTSETRYEMTSKTEDLQILGHTVRPEDYKDRKLEVIESSSIDLTEVVLETDEVTAVCPATGQRDFYTVLITYVPYLGRVVESKSAKLYFGSFATEGIFCEDFAGRIATDFQAALRSQRISVTVIQKPRGGITIKSTAAIRRM